MLRTLRYFEPARVRAVCTAAVALAIALGISVPAQVDGVVTALVAVLSVVLPLLQGELTRAVVTPAAIAQQHAEDVRPDDVEVDDAQWRGVDDSADPTGV